jgi:hypothetical protein
MNRLHNDNARSGERGAVSIKALLIMLAAAAVLFAVIKFVPVYVEQNKLIYDVDELARVASLRGYEDEKITRDIERIRGEYELPKDSIVMVSSGSNKVQLTLTYTRTIDLLVTSYEWQVEHKTPDRYL